MRNRISPVLLVAGTMLLAPVPAAAIPVLQLYIEGSTYNPASDTWEIVSGGPSFRLWTIGNVSGPGGAGGLPIQSVRLSAAYSHGATPTITLTPTQVGGTGSYTSGSTTFTDPSLSGPASYVQTVTDGSTPLLGDGSSLPSHGIFGAGTDWQEWALGDFTLHDSPIGDIINSFPTTIYQNKAQINAYDVQVSGGANLTVHFDLYDHVGAANHVKFSFAPFSHDATGSGGHVPEPASLGLIGFGLAVLGLARRRGQFSPR